MLREGCVVLVDSGKQRHAWLVDVLLEMIKAATKGPGNKCTVKHVLSYFQQTRPRTNTTKRGKRQEPDTHPEARVLLEHSFQRQ